jgi:hypothetical protein
VEGFKSGELINKTNIAFRHSKKRMSRERPLSSLSPAFSLFHVRPRPLLAAHKSGYNNRVYVCLVIQNAEVAERGNNKFFEPAHVEAAG